MEEEKKALVREKSPEKGWKMVAGAIQYRHHCTILRRSSQSSIQFISERIFQAGSSQSIVRSLCILRYHNPNNAIYLQEYLECCSGMRNRRTSIWNSSQQGQNHTSYKTCHGRDKKQKLASFTDHVGGKVKDITIAQEKPQEPGKANFAWFLQGKGGNMRITNTIVLDILYSVQITTRSRMKAL
jgi:hypothetical protein